MNREIVVINRHEPIMQWVRKMREEHINTNGILTILLSDKPWKTSEEIERMRELFRNPNNYWRDQVVYAIVLESFHLERDPKEGSVVTNGDCIGFAFNIDHYERTMDVYTDKSQGLFQATGVKIDDWDVLKLS